MSVHRAIPLLAVSLFLSSAFGETAPWQQGTVVSVEQRSIQPPPDYRCTTSPNGTQSSTACRPVGQAVQSWEVTVNLEDKVLVIRPYVVPTGAGGAVVALLRGAAHQSLKDYVLPPGVSAGAAIKVAVFSNGTATLQNGSGRNFTAEVISQTLVPGQRSARASSAEPVLSSRQSNTIDQKSEFPWKQVDDPNQRWKFTVRDEFVFGELAFPPERQRLGDFFAIDVKKQADRFVGTARLRVTVPAGTLTKACEWIFSIELTSVTVDRIEGNLSNERRQEGCDTLGKGENWDSGIWIREQ